MLAYEALPFRGRLPPGPLAITATRRFFRDDQLQLKLFARHGPVFKFFWTSGDLKVCIVGLQYARELLNRHRSSLRVVSGDLTSLFPGDYLRVMPAKIHSRYRSAFAGALRNDLVAGHEADFRRIIRTELDALAGVGTHDETLAERLHSTLDRISIRLLSLTVLGVAPDAPEFPALEVEYRRLGPGGYVAAVGPGQRDAYAAIRAVVLRVAAARRSGDSAGYRDSVLARLARNPEQVIDDTIVGNAIYMVERGRHDLRDLLRWVVKHLSDHPSVVAEVRAVCAEPGADRRLSEACVQETLRLEQAELLLRKATVPFTLEGYHVPKGSWVCALMRESHRDPAHFPEPERYRPERFLERTYTVNEYAPFGIGDHQCLGRTFNLRAGATFVEEISTGYDWTTVGDGPRVFGPFHWKPSASFAIALRRLPPTRAGAPRVAV
ncbi:MAG TPA: cytochrome P450 [Casimicrobiaceae bacterium]|nr:cytochrome P450 [Casimicrobiaceae bacterium]